MLHRLSWRDQGFSRTRVGEASRRATFMIDPCIPSSWPEYRISWRVGGTRYEITVSNPARRCRGIATATLDGAQIDALVIPLVDDGAIHDVQVVLGDRPSLTTVTASITAELPAGSGYSARSGR